MLPIQGVYEVAIKVKDLAQSEAFYRDVLDLQVGIRDEKRKWLFLRAGGQAGMIVLQEERGAFPPQHFAFTVREADVERAAKMLEERGVEIEGPVFHEWMPATSIYFSDPDGNALELCAPAG
ncbi:MAG: VOC family protein [Blastocatellia bacterium]